MNKFRKVAFCILTAIGLSAASGVSHAQTDIFLYIEGIPGESLDSQHQDEIDVLAWQWDYTSSNLNSRGHTGGSGRTICEPMSFVHYFDKASPTIALYGFTGAVIPEAELTVRKAGENPIEYVVIRLLNARVVSQNMGGKEVENRLTEKFSLNFDAIKIVYTQQNNDGSAGETTSFNWNCEANREF